MNDQISPSVLTVIQARMGSSRLPGKVLADIGGFPQIEFLVRRIKSAKFLGRLVLATTHHDADDFVATLGKQLKVPVVRGPEEDVLSRFMMALETFPADIVVRVTGDNPLTSPEIFDIVVGHLIKEDLDYVHSPDAPYGGAVDAFKASALKICSDSTDSGFDREHINGYILKNMSAFQTEVAPLPEEWCRSDVRITVDTPEDQASIRELVARLGPRAPNAPIDQIIRVYDQISE